MRKSVMDRVVEAVMREAVMDRVVEPVIGKPVMDRVVEAVMRKPVMEVVRSPVMETMMSPMEAPMVEASVVEGPPTSPGKTAASAASPPDQESIARVNIGTECKNRRRVLLIFQAERIGGPGGTRPCRHDHSSQ
jgi:hypothetical protein